MSSRTDPEVEKTLEQVFGREVSRRHALEREHSRLATKYQPDRRELENVCGRHS